MKRCAGLIYFVISLGILGSRISSRQKSIPVNVTYIYIISWGLKIDVFTPYSRLRDEICSQPPWVESKQQFRYRIHSEPIVASSSRGQIDISLFMLAYIFCSMQQMDRTAYKEGVENDYTNQDSTIINP